MLFRSGGTPLEENLGVYNQSREPLYSRRVDPDKLNNLMDSYVKME